MAGSVSLASAVSTGPCALTSCARNAVSAAARRFVRSGDRRSSAPTAAPIFDRMPLLRRTFLRPPSITPSALAPVAASSSSAGRVEVIDLVRTGVEEKTAVREGIEDRGRRRCAGRDQIVDAFVGLRKLVGREMRQGIVDRLGPGRACTPSQDQGQEHRRRVDQAGARYSVHGLAPDTCSDSARRTGPGSDREPSRCTGRARLPMSGRGRPEGRSRERTSLAAPVRSCKNQAAPPHLPLLTLKLPQLIGLRQSPIRSFEPSR